MNEDDEIRYLDFRSVDDEKKRVCKKFSNINDEKLFQIDSEILDDRWRFLEIQRLNENEIIDSLVESLERDEELIIVDMSLHFE